MSYLLGIGHATLDHTVIVARFPEPDTKVETSPRLVSGGGPAATALVTVVRLGERGAMAGAVGDDATGRRIRDGLAAEGVDVTHLLLRPGRRSPCSFVVVDEGARRTIFWNRGDAEPLRGSELPAGLVEGAAALLVDGHQPEAQRAAARRARMAEVPVVLDAGSDRPAVRQLLAAADHAVVSERFARSWCGRADGEALQAIRAAGPATVVITRGEQGCLGADGEAVEEAPALAGPVVDTNGAGDVFHGAYLVGLVRGLPLAERLRVASAAAGLKCRVPGARDGIPSWRETLSAAGLGAPRA